MGMVLASAISAFVVGVTEPIEFAFMFVAPVLFIIHALLTGLSLFIASLFQWTAGFSFSAGLIDYVLSLINPSPFNAISSRYCILYFILCYFRIMIKVLNLNTIGRGDNLLADPIVEETTTIDKSKVENIINQLHKY